MGCPRAWHVQASCRLQADSSAFLQRIRPVSRACSATPYEFHTRQPAHRVRPKQRVCTDVAGPFLPTSGAGSAGALYNVVLVCEFSKYSVTKAIAAASDAAVCSRSLSSAQSVLRCAQRSWRRVHVVHLRSGTPEKGIVSEPTAPYTPADGTALSA
jgi:hypothetical protein